MQPVTRINTSLSVAYRSQYENFIHGKVIIVSQDVSFKLHVSKFLQHKMSIILKLVKRKFIRGKVAGDGMDNEPIPHYSNLVMHTHNENVPCMNDT